MNMTATGNGKREWETIVSSSSGTDRGSCTDKGTGTSITGTGSMIVFSPELVQMLTSPPHRLAPVYVGVRRVRPSSHFVRKAALAISSLSVSDATSATTTRAIFSKRKRVQISTSTITSSYIASNRTHTQTLHSMSTADEDGINHLNLPVPKAQPTAPPTATITSTSSIPVFTSSEQQQQQQATAVYKVYTADGKERRMTSMEKKQAKWQEKLLAKDLKHNKEPSTVGIAVNVAAAAEMGGEEQYTVQSQTTSTGIFLSPDELGIKSEAENEETSEYYIMPLSLSVDPVRLEQELADLRGDREGVPPVMLPPALASVAKEAVRVAAEQNASAVQTNTSIVHNVQSNTNNNNNNNNYYNNNDDSITINGQAKLQQTGDEVGASPIITSDDNLAQEWATKLSESMQAAESVRQQEKEWRPMPYRLVPEVWSRLRPSKTVGPVMRESAPSGKLGDKNNAGDASTSENRSTQHHTDALALQTISLSPQKGRDYAFCCIRPSFVETTATDATSNAQINNNMTDEAAIIQFLYSDTNHLHISCGAKFGCDYLLYDGPRTERHAFAGLRVLHTHCSDTKDDTNKGEVQFPFPTAYDLAGYVRCLNTAGKLALLATVIHDDSTQQRCRVLLIDLALVKVAATASRRPRKTMEQRMKNLAKPES